MLAPVNTFIIYAKEDIEIKQSLLLHLNPFKNQDYNISIWHDEHIQAGDKWEQSIRSNLEQTDIFLMLISIHFLNSEFINNVEFKAAVDRHKEGKSIIIPIIIKHCQWNVNFYFSDYKFNLEELQVLPQGHKPIEEWPIREQGLNNVAGGIRKVLETFRNAERKKKAENDIQNAKKQIELIKTNPQNENAEDVFWRLVKNINKKSSYKNYLKKYPEGKYGALANKYINKFKSIEQQEKEQANLEIEKNLWLEAKTKKTVYSYNKYLKAYPNGLYQKQANAKMAEIKKSLRKPNAAFMTPLTSSPALADVIGSKPMPRTEIIRQLWDYIKKNKLQDQKNKRMINADEKLKVLFAGKSQISLFDLAKVVSRNVK